MVISGECTGCAISNGVARDDYIVVVKGHSRSSRIHPLNNAKRNWCRVVLNRGLTMSTPSIILRRIVKRSTRRVVSANGMRGIEKTFCRTPKHVGQTICPIRNIWSVCAIFCRFIHRDNCETVEVDVGCW